MLRLSQCWEQVRAPSRRGRPPSSGCCAAGKVARSLNSIGVGLGGAARLPASLSPYGIWTHPKRPSRNSIGWCRFLSRKTFRSLTAPTQGSTAEPLSAVFLFVAHRGFAGWAAYPRSAALAGVPPYARNNLDQLPGKLARHDGFAASFPSNCRIPATDGVASGVSDHTQLRAGGGR